jgi:hypothetical protein
MWLPMINEEFMKKIKLLAIMFLMIFVCSCGADQITKDVLFLLRCRSRVVVFEEGKTYQAKSVHDNLIKFGMIQINQTTKKCELTKKGRENYLDGCGGKTGIISADLELIDIEKRKIGKSNGEETYILNIKVKTKVRPWLKDEYQKSTDSYMKALYKNIIESDGETDTLSTQYPFRR